MTTSGKSVPHEMRALQIIEPGQARVIKCPVPNLEPGEVLLRVEAIATCPHWDIHIMDGVPMFADRPLNYPYVVGEPGHEAVGRIASLGAGTSDFEIGQRVATWRDPGARRQGCYAEYVPVAAEHILPVPERLSAESIASLELAMCVQVSVDQMTELGVVEGRRVAVAGLGPSGLIAAQLLRRAGAAEVVAVEPDVSRHELGRTVGADRVISPSELPHDDRFGDSAFYAALDTTGLKRSIEALMGCTRRAVAIFGVLRESVEFGPGQWWGGFSLLGYGEHNRGAAVRALAAIVEGSLDLSVLVSRKSGLTQYAMSVESLRDRSSIKVLFDPST